MTRPLPVGAPLSVIMLTVLLADRALGLTSFAVVPQSGFGGGLLAGGVVALLADVLAVIAVVLVLLVVRRLGRPRGRRELATASVVAALLGLQLGAVAVEVVTGRPVPLDLYLARGLLLGGSTAAALSLLAALAEHRRVTQELRSATAAAESLAASGRAALAALREDVAGRVRVVLGDALAALEAGGPSGSGTRLRSLADDVVRPLSHRLAAAPVPPLAVPAVSVARWRDTLTTLVRSPVVPARTLALIAAGLAFLRSLVTDQDSVRDLSPAIPPDAEGSGVALTVDLVPFLVVVGELVLLLVVVGWSAGRLAELVQRRRATVGPARAWLRVAVGIGGIAALTVIVPTIGYGLTGLADGTMTARDAAVAVAASFVPLLAVSIGASLAAAVVADRAALESALADQQVRAAHTAARVQAVLGHEQRRMARSLHADVQATINAGGLLLDRADREGGVIPAHLDDVAARIAASVERFLAGGVSDEPLTARLSEVRALWAGVCTVDVAVDDRTAARVDADVVTRELVVDLVTEACANAVVHGDAGEVRVRLALAGSMPDGEEVELEVVDDGTGGRAQVATPSAARPGTPAATADGTQAGGLGTEVLRASCTSFSLDVGEQGGRLHALLPLG